MILTSASRARPSTVAFAKRSLPAPLNIPRSYLRTIAEADILSQLKRVYATIGIRFEFVDQGHLYSEVRRFHNAG